MFRTVIRANSRSLIGLTTVAAALATQQGFCSSADGSKVAFSPKEWRKFEVSSVQTLSHDTKLLRVKLPTADSETGLVTASCLMVQGKSLDGSKDVARPYTPTTLNSQKGYFDLVIKRYPNGNVSNFVHKLQPGDSLTVKGPFMKIKLEPNMKKNIGMIAGGTGITPMYQCILEILSNPADKTQITLLYANRSPSDILLKKELDALAAKHKNFKVVYKVDAPDDRWKGPVGHITLDDISTVMPQPAQDNLILVCGPPGLMKFVSGDKAEDKTQGPLEGLLRAKGYSENMVYKF